jgi:Transposase domain (DUF772)
MLVTLLVWAYANGITSSRRIERLCGQDVAFRVICAGNLPDHVTVARFRQQFAETAAGLFAQVLVLCARLGMGQAGMVAVDGMKIAANASKDANRTEEGLRKLAADLAARHAETDAEDDALFGAGQRGDDDPGDPRTRRERIAAALASIEAERERREAEQAADRARAARAVEAARAGSCWLSWPWPGQGRSTRPGRLPGTRRPRRGGGRAGSRRWRRRITPGSAPPARGWSARRRWRRPARRSGRRRASRRGVT